MDREHLLELRKRVWQRHSQREMLGEFDANSEVILFGLATCMEIIDHLLEEQKGVHSKAKSKTD